jgi:hypothetical protein
VLGAVLSSVAPHRRTISHSGCLGKATQSPAWGRVAPAFFTLKAELLLMFVLLAFVVVSVTRNCCTG